MQVSIRLPFTIDGFVLFYFKLIESRLNKESLLSISTLAGIILRHKLLCEHISCPCKKIEFDKFNVSDSQIFQKRPVIDASSQSFQRKASLHSERKTIISNREDDTISKITEFMECIVNIMKERVHDSAWPSLLLAYLLFFVKDNKIAAIYELIKCSQCMVSYSVVENYHIFFMK